MSNPWHFGQYFALKLLSKGAVCTRASTGSLESAYYGFLFQRSLFPLGHKRKFKKHNATQEKRAFIGQHLETENRQGRVGTQ